MLFSYLPLEIWDRILFCLADQDLLQNTKQNPLATLHFLTLSCKYLYSLKRHLYRCISTDQCDIVLLFRSIVENPDLALYVKSLRFIADSAPYTGRHRSVLIKYRVFPERSDESIYPLRNNDIAAVLTEALILKCRRLEELSLNLSNLPPNSSLFNLDWVRETSFGASSPPLPALKTLQAYSGDRHLYTDDLIAKVQYLVHALQPKHLHICALDPLSVRKVEAPFLALSSVEISCSRMTISDFTALVKNCPNLSSVCYRMDETSARDVFTDYEFADVLDIVRALSPLAKTLKALELHFLLETDCEPFFLDSRLSLPDLAQLYNLEELTIDFKSCLSVVQGTGANAPPFVFRKTRFLNKLPRSLTKLRICNADSCVLPELQQLPTVVEETLPNLKQITLKDYWGPVYEHIGLRLQDRVDSTRLLIEVDEALAKAGVQLVLLSPDRQRVVPSQCVDDGLASSTISPTHLSINS